MQDRFLTGNLDADRLILTEVDDRELFSLCIPKKKEDTYSKYAQKLCNEDFFRNRTMGRFPWTVEYRGSLSWKKYYASIVFYISEMMDENAMRRFGHQFPFDANKYQGNPKSQYAFFKRYANRILNDLLTYASAGGELGIVKFLVEKGANIHARDDYALRLASENGHLSVVKYLTEQGANIHTANGYALSLASMRGHLSVVEYLVRRGVDIHTVSDLALRLASEKGHLSVVKWLVEQGADVHALADHALQLASRNGHLDVVEYLKSFP